MIVWFHPEYNLMGLSLEESRTLHYLWENMDPCYVWSESGFESLGWVEIGEL